MNMTLLRETIMRCLRVSIACFLGISGSIALAADDVMERAIPIQPPISSVPLPPLDQQIVLLQPQVQVLQKQVAVLQSALQVTPTGVLLQGPAVAISGGNVSIQAQTATAVTSGTTLSIRTGSDLSLTQAAPQ
jgi:hypothetical protein